MISCNRRNRESGSPPRARDVKEFPPGGYTGHTRPARKQIRPG